MSSRKNKSAESSQLNELTVLFYIILVETTLKIWVRYELILTQKSFPNHSTLW